MRGVKQFGETVETCVEIAIAEQEAENPVVQLDEPGQSTGAGRAARVIHCLEDLAAEQSALVGQERTRLPPLALGHARQVQDQIDARSFPGDVLLQVGVQGVVFAIQLRRQTDHDGLPFER